MGTTTFEVDIARLAQVLHDRHDFALQFVHQDFHSGFDPGAEHGRGLKYPLRRLGGLRQITEDDERELGALVDALRAGDDVTAAAKALRNRDDASPLARTLAGVVLAEFLDLNGPRWREQALAGAIAGAYLFDSLSHSGDQGPGALPRELVEMLGAIGGALAMAASVIVRQAEERRPEPS
jgi:hypothetical protein